MPILHQSNPIVTVHTCSKEEAVEEGGVKLPSAEDGGDEKDIATVAEEAEDRQRGKYEGDNGGCGGDGGSFDRRHRNSSRAVHSVMKEELPFARRLLLFCGVLRPGPRSPFWIFRIGWLVLMMFEFTVEFSFVVSYFGSSPLVWLVAIPMMLQSAACISARFFLLPKVQSLICEEAQLMWSEVRMPTFMSATFVASFLVMGIIHIIRHYIEFPHKRVQFLGGILPGTLVGVADLLATVPSLGAIVLVLGLELTHAKNDVKALVQAARGK